MANMSHRVTYAVDEKTANGVQFLASLWKVSKSEAMRIAIQRSVERHQATQSPQEALQKLRSLTPLKSGTGERWMQEIRSQREKDLGA